MAIVSPSLRSHLVKNIPRNTSIESFHLSGGRICWGSCLQDRDTGKGPRSRSVGASRLSNGTRHIKRRAFRDLWVMHMSSQVSVVLRVFFDPVISASLPRTSGQKKAQALSECENDRAKNPKPEARAEEKIFYSAPISAIVNDGGRTPAPGAKLRELIGLTNQIGFRVSRTGTSGVELLKIKGSL